jgi:hypothetical protein
MEQLVQAIGSGWSPFLHEFVLRSKGHAVDASQSRYFWREPSCIGMFKQIHDTFPALVDTWRLLPRTKPGESWGKHYKTAGSTPWRGMGHAQKKWLIHTHPDLLAAPKFSTVDDKDCWMMAMAMALMPSPLVYALGVEPARVGQHDPEMQRAPFHGYFQSKAWADLVKESASTAQELAVILSCVSGLDGST